MTGQPVKFGRRASAYIIDLALLYFATVCTSILFVMAYCAIKFPGETHLIAEFANSANTKFFTRAAHVIYYFSYFTIAHWYFGRTFGKWLMGLHLRNRDGSELTFLRSLGRSGLYIVSGQIALGIGFILPLFRKDGQTLHDLIISTEVVNDHPPILQIEQKAA